MYAINPGLGAGDRLTPNSTFTYQPFTYQPVVRHTINVLCMILVPLNLDFRSISANLRLLWRFAVVRLLHRVQPGLSAAVKRPLPAFFGAYVGIGRRRSSGARLRAKKRSTGQAMQRGYNTSAVRAAKRWAMHSSDRLQAHQFTAAS